MHKVEDLFRGRVQDGRMVGSGGSVEVSRVNLELYLVEGQEKTTGCARHAVETGVAYSVFRQMVFWRCWDRDGIWPGGQRTPCGGCRFW